MIVVIGTLVVFSFMFVCKTGTDYYYFNKSFFEVAASWWHFSYIRLRCATRSCWYLNSNIMAALAWNREAKGRHIYSPKVPFAWLWCGGSLSKSLFMNACFPWDLFSFFYKISKRILFYKVLFSIHGIEFVKGWMRTVAAIFFRERTIVALFFLNILANI